MEFRPWRGYSTVRFGIFLFVSFNYCYYQNKENSCFSLNISLIFMSAKWNFPSEASWYSISRKFKKLASSDLHYPTPQSFNYRAIFRENTHLLNDLPRNETELTTYKKFLSLLILRGIVCFVCLQEEERVATNQFLPKFPSFPFHVAISLSFSNSIPTVLFLINYVEETLSVKAAYSWDFLILALN